RVLDENPAAPTLMYRMGDERDVMKDRPPVTPGAPAFLGGHRLKIEPVSLPPTAFYPGLRPFVQRAAVADCEAPVGAAEVALAQARRTLSSGNGIRAVGGVAVTAAPLPLLVAESALAAAKARLAAVRARVAADNVRNG